MSLTYEEFRAVVKAQIRNFLPEKLSHADIHIEEVTKNNHVKLYGLVIRDPEKLMVPTLYLESCYEKYQKGIELGNILTSLVAQYEQAMEKESALLPVALKDYEQMKDKLYLTVINQDNQEYLKEAVHQDIPETDLTSVVRVRCGDEGKQGIGSFILKEALLSEWGQTKEEVYEQALTNTEKLFPAELINIQEVIRSLGLLLNGMKQEEESTSRNLLPYEQYVLSNEEKFYGATAILYPGLLKEIGEATKSNFFLLPSSIHEVILMKDNGEMSAEELQRMVMDINRTQVDPAEVLSDEVYCYDYREQKLIMATDPLQTKELVQQIEGMDEQENFLEEERTEAGIER